MKVQDLITSNVKSCRPETSLAAAAVDMWENDCGALPVVDGEGKVIGLITDRDIAIAVGTRGASASQVAVGEVISRNAYCCRMDEDLKAATTIAIQEMIDFLAATKGLTKHEAYQLVSIAGNVAITQLVDKPVYGVHVRMPKGIFK